MSGTGCCIPDACHMPFCCPLHSTPGAHWSQPSSSCPAAASCFCNFRQLSGCEADEGRQLSGAQGRQASARQGLALPAERLTGGAGDREQEGSCGEAGIVQEELQEDLEKGGQGRTGWCNKECVGKRVRTETLQR